VDGGLIGLFDTDRGLTDVSALSAITVDVDRRLALAEPVATHKDLAERIVALGPAFPIGHCPSVGLGEYLLADREAVVLGRMALFGLAEQVADQLGVPVVDPAAAAAGAAELVAWLPTPSSWRDSLSRRHPTLSPP
jgi:hypothetical protein